jgi:hypothetical protein
MFWKSDKPTPEQQAKAAYCLFVGNAKLMIDDLAATAKTITQLPNDFRAFIGNELGLLMCHTATVEAYRRFFENLDDARLFTDTLFDLFHNHLKITTDDLKTYATHAEISENPNIMMLVFSSRIIAFLLPEASKDIMAGDVTSLGHDVRYADKVLAFSDSYAEIFKAINGILEFCITKCRKNSKAIIKYGNKVNEWVGQKAPP